MDDRLETMEESCDGYDRTPDGDIFCRALPILIVSCHPLFECKISYGYCCASLGVLIADTSTIKSGEAREWIACLELSINSGEKNMPVQ